MQLSRVTPSLSKAAIPMFLIVLLMVFELIWVLEIVIYLLEKMRKAFRG